jgi:hypothetical protein
MAACTDACYLLPPACHCASTRESFSWQHARACVLCTVTLKGVYPGTRAGWRRRACARSMAAELSQLLSLHLKASYSSTLRPHTLSVQDSYSEVPQWQLMSNTSSLPDLSMPYYKLSLTLELLTPAEVQLLSLPASQAFFLSVYSTSTPSASVRGKAALRLCPGIRHEGLVVAGGCCVSTLLQAPREISGLWCF